MTNDDGIYSEGLWVLYKRFSRHHTVTVVAPDREKSAVGHGITVDRPLRATPVMVRDGFQAYAVTGTPADCIKLGILEILKYRPDLVISGINPGLNVGININYSGTVAAAREAALNGIAAVAISVKRHSPERYEDAAGFVEMLADHITEKGLPFGTFLNVNIPDRPLQDTAGIRMSRQEITCFPEYFEKRKDPRNRTYFWRGRDMQPLSNDTDIDGNALCGNFITITPIQCDTTDYSTLEELATWGLSIGGTQ